MIFYKQFNGTNDIYTNSAKKYYESFIPYDTTLTIGTSAINTRYSTASYNGVEVFNAISGSSDSTSFKSVQALLRGALVDTTTTWIPVSSSTLGIATEANTATFISFNRNLIGDKMCIYSAEHAYPTVGFRFSSSTGYHYVYDAQTTAMTTDLNSNFIVNTSNFGLVCRTSSTTRPDPSAVNWATSFAGLFFGSLGMIMLYTGSATPPVIGTEIRQTNFIYQQSFNSKTFFCRVTNQVFNASTNRTWVTYSADADAYVVLPGKNYVAITGIGLYNNDGQLLAIAKLSQPVLKYSDSEMHAKVTIQY